MSRRTALLIALVLAFIIALTVTVYLLAQPSQPTKPTWFKLGGQVTYTQMFEWSGHQEREYMTWELTNLRNDTVDLHLTSHGISVSHSNVTIVPGQADWTVNAYTREITSSTDPNHAGKKCPFWIETNVKLDSSVETSYGIARISKNESVSVLGQYRSCWVLQYTWPTSSMTRWYDKATGLCLKIRVTMRQQDPTITITETATLTNIDLTT